MLPPEAFASQATSPPVGDLGITELPVRNAPASTLDDFFGPPVPMPGSELLAGTGLETLEAPAIDYSNKFGKSCPAMLLEVLCKSCPCPGKGALTALGSWMFDTNCLSLKSRPDSTTSPASRLSKMKSLKISPPLHGCSS